MTGIQYKYEVRHRNKDRFKWSQLLWCREKHHFYTKICWCWVFFRLFEAFFKGSFQSTATLVFSSDTCSLNTIISNQVILRGSLFVFSFLVQPLPNPPSSTLLPQLFPTTKKQRTQGCVTWPHIPVAALHSGQLRPPWVEKKSQCDC